MNTVDATPQEPVATFSPFRLNRANQILLGLLALQVVIAVAVFWLNRPSTEVSRLVLDSFTMEDVVGLTITNDQGDQITLKKGAEGWGLPEADDYPVDVDKVTEVLEKVVGLNTKRLVTRTEASHKRLQVADDDFARKLTVETAGGDSHTLFIGSAPSAGGTHIRLAGQDEAYLTGDLNAWQLDPRTANWINTEYFTIPSDDITAIHLQNTKADLTFEKDDAGEWTMVGLAEDEELLPNNIISLANRLASIRLVEPIGKTEEDWFTLDDPQATVTITTKNEAAGEQTFTLQVGAKDDDNQYVLHASNSPYYVLVAQFTVNDLLERDRAAYLAQPEESEGGAIGTEGETGETTGSE